MNPTIQRELNEFEKYHKNIYNISFHVVCGFVFMTFLFLLSKKYSHVLLILYALLLLLTINNVLITSITVIILFIMIYFISQYDISLSTKLIIFFTFYFLSSVSHFVTGEPTVLNISNTSVYSVAINTFYFIPFTIVCLNQYLFNIE
jgi:hypothetical protein